MAARGRGQQPAMPVVGFINGSTARSSAGNGVATAFSKGLNEAGYFEGKNVVIEYRWADGQYERFPTLAADLVSRRVDVIFVSGGAAAPRAAINATTTIPIVFSIGADPVKLGFVQSLNPPGGNVTGVSFLINALGAKRLGLLHDLVPTAGVFGFLVNPSNPSVEADTTEMKRAAEALGGTLIVNKASTDDEIDGAFTSFHEHGIAGLAVAADAFFSSRADRLASLAATHRIPAIYSLREYANAGGLMAWRKSTAASLQAGVLTGRILKGRKTRRATCDEVDNFEFVFDLKLPGARPHYPVRGALDRRRSD